MESDAADFLKTEKISNELLSSASYVYAVHDTIKHPCRTVARQG